MRRRSVLHGLLATVGSSTLAGCNALSGFDSTPPATPDSAASDSSATAGTPGSPTSSRGTAPSDAPGSPQPYRAANAPSLDRPRGVHVRNLGSTERFLTVVVTADGDAAGGARGDDRGIDVLADSVTVPPGDTVSFPGLLASAGEYGVLVETADGDRERYDWAVRPALDDLWVDLTPDLSFRRPVVCFADCSFAVATDDQTVAYDVPSDVTVGDALGRVPALAIDNDTPGRLRARLHVWNRGRLRFASTYDLPPDVRALVPVLPASQRYDVVLRTDEGEAIYDWQPSVRNTLYASLANGPSFRCGYADHDVQVRNETDRARQVRVRVLTGEETLFERTFELDPNAVRTVPSAVDPAGPFRFEVETGDGVTEEYNWVRCAPNGPITVAVSDDGVYVSVQPVRGSS